MPRDQAWTGPEPYLVAAAAELSADRGESCAAALNTAEGMVDRLPSGRDAAARLAAAVIRLAITRRTGDLPAAAAAVSQAEALVCHGAGGAARPEQAHPGADAVRSRNHRAVVGPSRRGGPDSRCGCGRRGGPGGEHERAACLGRLALVEVLRGRLRHAAKLAGQAAAALAAEEQRPPPPHPDPAALAALAWVHLERGELPEARIRLKQLDAALGASPDKLIGAVACLVAACGYLAEGHGEAAAQMAARARSGWAVPAWLDQRLTLVQSRAYATAGDIPAAVAAAQQAGRDNSPEAAAALAHAWLAAGDDNNARRALAPALAAHSGKPDRVRLHEALAEARLSYHNGDSVRGRRSLASALRLAEREQLRVPFIIERGWIGPALRRDPELAGLHRHLFASAPRHDQPRAMPGAPATGTVLAVEPLTKREREVLQHVSGMLNTAEVASEMYISINTVKAHLKSIYRKLAATHRSEAVRRARQLELI